MDNRTLIRAVNEAVAARFVREEWMELLCECGRPGCTRLVAVRRVDFDSITSVGGGFVVDREHSRAPVESSAA